MSLKPVISISRLFFLIWLCSLPGQTFAQSLLQDSTRMHRYKEEAAGLVRFFQFTLNTLGDPSTPAREKDILIQDSYLKMFQDPDVQIEDDLVPNRSVVTNKDVQAYLKDVDFFFRQVQFEFTDIQVEHRVNEEGDLFFVVSLLRFLDGITIDGDSLRNSQQRYVEINLDEENRVLKIASMYTTRLGEVDALVEWWDNLDMFWKSRWGKDFFVYDSLPLLSLYEERPFLSLRDSIRKRNVSPFEQHTDSGVVHVGDLSIFNAEQAQPQGNELATNPEPAKWPVLSESLVKELKLLVSQRALDLSGESGLDDLTPLSMFKELRSLNISQTSVFDLSPLRNLTHLEFLNASQTDVRNLEPLRYATQLKELYLGHTRVTNDTGLERFANLRVLDLNHNSLTNLNHIGQLIALRDLSLNATFVKDVSALSSLTHLQRLALSDSWVEDLKGLSALKNLDLLFLERSPVRDLQPLESCLGLRQLFLDNTSISSLKPLQNLPVLTRVYCDSTLIGHQEAQAFMTQRPDVLVIYESDRLLDWWNQIPGYWKEIMRNAAGIEAFRVGREELQQMANVEKIDVSGHREILSLKPLEVMPNLKWLDCSSTAIDNLDPLINLNDLEYLNCSNTNIQSLGPLSAMSRLQQLDVEGTLVESLDGLDGAIALKLLKADSTLIEWLHPLDSLARLSAVFVDGTRVTDIEINRFLRARDQVLVIFESARLIQWWGDLSKEWKSALANFGSITDQPDAESLHRLTQVSSLSFSDQPGLADLHALTVFRKLIHLQVESSMVRDLSPLVSMPQIQTLILSENPIIDLSPLASVRDLTHLQVDNTLVEELGPLESLRHLRILKCKGTAIRRLNPLENVLRLQQIDLSNTDVRSLNPLEELPALLLIECYNTRISDRRIEKFQEDRPEVEIIHY